MKNYVLPAYYLFLEGLCLYFLLFVFYIGIGKVPSVPAFIAFISAGILCLAASLKFKKAAPVISLAGGILGGGAGFLLGFGFMSAFVCTIFLIIRLDAFSKDPTLWSSERTKLPLIMYCSSIPLFMMCWMLKYHYINWLFAIIILFTALFSAGKLIKSTEKRNGVHDTKSFGIFFGLALLLAAGIAGIFMPAIKWLFFKTVGVLVLIASILAAPLFKLAKIIQSHSSQNAIPESVVGKSNAAKKEIDTFYLHISPWVWVIVAILTILIVWLLVKKFRTDNIDTVETTGIVNVEFLSPSGGTKRHRRFFGTSSPQEYLRKLVYDLQIFADKHGNGRKEYETLREWFERTDFPSQEDFFNAYDHIRYGKGVLLKKDARHFEELVEKVKKDIKEKKVL